MKTSKNENKTKEHMVAKDFKTSVLPVSNKLLRFATRFLHDEDQARDVVQDVFLKLWQRKETLDEVENIEAFAMRMTRNRCLDVIRANKTVPIDEDTDRRLKAKTVDVHSKVELGESARQIKKLIGQLPELQQNVMHMRDIEQLSYDEIAEATGLKRNAIRVNLSRARKKVRDEFLKINRNDGNTRNTTITTTLL
ncbi:sigma-70 family RNA polymerase sigma factor [uncultured Draconibacterium sp.]|uniref:RNA polymerase sigma factor n=1 Tax=uncultured Draconibacterium sp. TaxID=1573823 RepID=UPI002AA80E7B|nr:sigma-70 family RNA polymerase sigma factor [uncultured Draconibacterium sp.]